ncbi:ABC transporter ATP-binding protein [Cohnella boryungensis]|uniref:ABC transporter ATP-binding protein n=1 Tax=Cohnella boryungensis TaxID=768479 RepID=A0ABV8SEH8_9BACL
MAGMNGVGTTSPTEPLGSAASQEIALSVRGLTYGFDEASPLFQSLSFDIAQGEFASFVMPSGMGKTTLFRLLAGLLKPQAGTIAVYGSPHEEEAEAKAKPGKLGYMPQRDCLMPWRSVADNAALGLELSGVSKREARRRVEELLPSFGLEGKGSMRVHELSGGMRQRISFMRTLLGGGDVLLLDEPFSALDAMTRVAMQEWLLRIWEQNRKTVLFITHDVDEALLLSDRVFLAATAPVASLREVAVSPPRPRVYEDVLEGSFVDLKRRVLKLLDRGTGARGGLSHEA